METRVYMPKVGQIVKVKELPSYQRKYWPSLPVIVLVKRIEYDNRVIVVEIDGKDWELYEGDGYEECN